MSEFAVYRREGLRPKTQNRKNPDPTRKQARVDSNSLKLSSLSLSRSARPSQLFPLLTEFSHPPVTLALSKSKAREHANTQSQVTHRTQFDSPGSTKPHARRCDSNN